MVGGLALVTLSGEAPYSQMRSKRPCFWSSPYGIPPGHITLWYSRGRHVADIQRVVTRRVPPWRVELLPGQRFTLGAFSEESSFLWGPSLVSGVPGTMCEKQYTVGDIGSQLSQEHQYVQSC